MQNLEFVHDIDACLRPGAFHIMLDSSIQNREDLLRAYQQQMRFPSFAFNWDALEDGLRDLEWIREKDILLLHRDVPSLTADELDTYLGIVNDIAAHWKQLDEHNVAVIFSEKDRPLIMPV